MGQLLRSFDHPTRSGVHHRAGSWVRVAALLCLLLIVFATTVQVCHIHPEQNGQTDNCPLCVAMHSALPASLHTVAAAPVRAARTYVVAERASAGGRIWAYELSNRPPPVA